MLLNYGNAWELDESVCPADVHLIEWIKRSKIQNSTLFHMGTGAHHLLGTTMSLSGSENLVIGLTASPDEYQRFMDMMIENPFIGRCYKPLFGDIYQLDVRQLPDLDVVSVFHLGEFSNEIRHSVLGLTNNDVLDILISKIKPNGKIIFYRNSFGMPNIKHLIDERFTLAEEFKSLLVYDISSR